MKTPTILSFFSLFQGFRTHRSPRTGLIIPTPFGLPRESEGPVFRGPVPVQCVEELTPYLVLSPKNPQAIRSAKEYAGDVGPLRDQILALIDHLYARHPVPLFLYRAMLTETGLRVVFPDERHSPDTKMRTTREAPLRKWFFAVARGEPFATVAKGSLTKREAHWFLKSPAHGTVRDNLLWARLAALGVPHEGCDDLVERSAWSLRELSGTQFAELGRFFARVWNEMAATERQEIVDFVRARIGDPGFILDGRTLTSVRRLCEEWHERFREVSFTPTSSELNSKWKSRFKPWEHRTTTGSVQAIELTSGRALSEEGYRQSHCVVSYLHACRKDQSRIVSMAWHDETSERPSEPIRLTLEVDVRRRTVVQIRGKRNRRATSEERGVIGLWAEGCRLKVSPDA